MYYTAQEPRHIHMYCYSWML